MRHGLGSAIGAVALVALAAPAPVAAGPAPELVVYWSATAEPALVSRIEATARARGAAVIDQSPPRPSTPEAPRLLAAGITAYDELRFDDAAVAFDQALAACDRTGADGLERDALSDLLLYRGLTHIQQGQVGAWDELIAAVRVDATRVLDPARFPPRAIEQQVRAREAVALMPRARLEVAAPAGCTVFVDGVEAVDAAVVPHGDHWVRAACRDHRPWGRRVTVDRDPVTITATPAATAPPDDAAALIQARAAGAPAVIDVQVLGGFARLRRRTVDGRDAGQATVALTADAEASAASVVDALAGLLGRTAPRARWYRSRWTWAAAGAAAAAAVLVPLLVLDDHGAATVVIRPSGWPPW